MKYILSFVCFALLTTRSAWSQDLQDLYLKTLPHVVEVSMRDADGDVMSFGSGFLISENRVVTNYHVVNYGWSSVCKLSDGTEIPVSGVVASSIEKDLAVIELSRKMVGKGLRLSNTLPNPGQRVAVIGCPVGLSASLSDGVVSAIQDHETHGKVIQMTAAISHGNSGGPVLNMDGEVVGVVSYMRIDGNSLNFAIPSNEVARLSYGAPIAINSFNKARNENPEVAKYAGGSLSLAPVPSFQIPEGAIDRLRGNDKREIAEACKYSMILPNGDIIGLYRFFRTIELIQISRNLPSTIRHLEALGNETGKSSFRRPDGTSITIDLLPLVVDLPTNSKHTTNGIIVDLPLVGHDIPIEYVLQVEGLVLCGIGDVPILIRNSKDAHVPAQGLFGDRVYFPVGTYNAGGEIIPVYDAYDPLEHRPTLDEMAYHAERGGAAVVLYDYKIIHEHGKQSRTVGGGSTRSRVSTSTIEGINYRWNRRVPTLRFIDQPSEPEVDVQAEADEPLEVLPEITHILRLTDGRIFKGRLLSDSGRDLVFMMVSGSIEHEMTLSKSKVKEIETIE